MKDLGGNLRGRCFGVGSMFEMLETGNLGYKTPIIQQLSLKDVNKLYEEARGLLTQDLKLKSGKYFFIATGLPIDVYSVSGRKGWFPIGAAIQNVEVADKYKQNVYFNANDRWSLVVGEFTVPDGDPIDVIPNYISFIIFESLAEDDVIHTFDKMVYREKDELEDFVESRTWTTILRQGENWVRFGSTNTLGTEPVSDEYYNTHRDINMRGGKYLVFNSYVRGYTQGNVESNNYTSEVALRVAQLSPVNSDGVPYMSYFGPNLAGAESTDEGSQNYSTIYIRRLLDHDLIPNAYASDFEALSYNRVKRPKEYHPVSLMAVSEQLGVPDPDGTLRQFIRNSPNPEDRWKDNIIVDRFGYDGLTKEPTMFYIRAFKKSSSSQSSRIMNFSITLQLEDSSEVYMRPLTEAQPWACFPTRGEKVNSILIQWRAGTSSPYPIKDLMLQIVAFS